MTIIVETTDNGLKRACINPSILTVVTYTYFLGIIKEKNRVHRSI